jgi:hypothetical protein
MPFDFTIRDPTDRLIAVLEAKAQRGVSADWAARFRRNLVAHFGSPDTDFFGVVTPETLFLWQRQPDGGLQEQPNFVIDLSEYFGKLPERVFRGPAFELVVSSWLSDLTDDPQPGSTPLDGTGLLEAIHNGRIILEAAA